MSTPDQSHDSGSSSSLEQLADEDQPVVTDAQDQYRSGDDPDAVDSVTGRSARAGDDPLSESVGAAGAAGAGGMAGSTGGGGMGVPLLAGAREVESEDEGEGSADPRPPER